MMKHVDYAEWIFQLAVPGEIIPTREARIARAARIALGSVKAGGGPFGALITSADGTVIALGHNNVVPGCDSTAHAEVMAIRNAQSALQTIELGKTPFGRLEIYANAAPCIMCFGAIWWSRLSALYSAATAADVELAGFQEGPVSEAMWQEIEATKGINVHREFCRSEEIVATLRDFPKHGTLY